MRVLFFTFSLIISFLLAAESTSNTLLSQIGPVLTPPVEYNGQIYFMATTGVLYKADYALAKAEKVFQTEKSSIAPILIDESVAYLGEGIHEDIKTNFYAFDLQKEKIKFQLSIQGHIERAPLITEHAIYLGLGPGGIMALDKKNGREIWRIEKIKQGKLHVDARPVVYNEDSCFPTIYEFKGIVCLNHKNGKPAFFLELGKSPKSQVVLSGKRLVGMAMEANMIETKWESPAALYVINLASKKKEIEIDLRGYSFSAPLLLNDEEAFVALSTGDLLLIQLSDGKISYIGEMQGPITSNPFFKDGAYCAISIMGRLACFTRLKEKFELIRDQSLVQNIIGEIGYINDKFYAPSRMGYLL